MEHNEEAWPLLIVRITLNGRTVEALADSGASISIIQRSFVLGLGLELNDCDIQAEIANGAMMDALGKVRLLAELPGVPGPSQHT